MMGEGPRPILSNDYRELEVGIHGLDVYTPSNSSWNPCVIVFIVEAFGGDDGSRQWIPQGWHSTIF